VDLILTMVGTAASVPTAARGTSATMIARGGRRWLVDCGEGTQRQLMRSGLGLVDLDLVLLTHLHGDHYLGLPGLLKSYGLRDRERPLTVIGPRGLTALMTALRPVIGRVPFPLALQESDGGTVWAGEGARIEAVPTRHSVASLGYALVEDLRPGAFDPAAARALGVEEGPLWGRLQRGESVPGAGGAIVRPDQVMGPARPGRTIVFSGDTEPCDSLLEIARGATVLIHEATFLDEDRERARQTRHSTAREAAALAREADVGLLVLTHLSSRCMPRDVRAEAAAEFARIAIPRDFDQIEVPFPEKGPPELHPARAPAGPRAAQAAAEEPATVSAPDL